MSDFLACAQDLLRLKRSRVVEARKDFEDIFNAISELQIIHAKSNLDLDNIEIVFGAIEMGLLLRRLGNKEFDYLLEEEENQMRIRY